jgi:hypothetical protein
MRSHGVRLTIAILALAGLVGCSSSSITKTTLPTLSSIAVTPVGPAISVGGSVQLKATGTYSDQSTQDLTSTATWTSSPSGIVSVSGGGNVTGATAGIATITATSGTVSGSTAVSVTSQNVGPSPNSSYAFFLRTSDSRGAAFIVGSLTTDSSGNINGGEADYNMASGVGNITLTASNYTVLADGRGEVDLTFNFASPQTYHMAFVLSDVSGGVASKGKMISYDSHIASGEFGLQTAGASLAANTYYVFGFSGLDATNQPEAEIGFFNTNPSVKSYHDVNDNGTIDGGTNPPPSAGQVLSPVTMNTFDPNTNRGTATLGAANYAYYTTDSTKAYFIETADTAGTALAGVAEQQGSGLLGLPLLSPESTPSSPCPAAGGGDESECNYAYLLNHAASAQNGTFERAGQFNFCNCTSGGLNYALEDDSDGSAWTITSGTRYFGGFRGVFDYKVANKSNQGQRYAIFYEVNQTATDLTASSGSKLYVMNTDSNTPGIGAADFIDVKGDSTLANAPPAVGTYVYSATNVGGTNLLQLGLVSFDINGNAAGVGYINNNGALSTAAGSGVFTPSTDSSHGGNGRGTLSLFGTSASAAAYNVGSKGLIVVDSGSHINGRLEPQ